MIRIAQNKSIWFTISGLLVTAGIISIAVFGLNFGIDFTGGALMEVTIDDQSYSTDEIGGALAAVGYEETRIQQGEDSYLIRFSALSEDQHQEALAGLTSNYELVEELRFEMVGPTISGELKNKTIWAIAILVVLIILYVAWAFRKVSEPIKSWKYGILTIVAAAHDIIISVGVFALFGHLFGFQIDVAFVAALLTILGYSINDTIVVFDRIRENLRDWSTRETFDDLVNRSIKQTIARSINTSVTTLLALSAIAIWGGASTQQFAIALIVGVIAGAYSSIFLASPLLTIWKRK